ncbi:MAG: methylmalonyl-CoA epimerase [Anaerolineae bacterium]
MIKRIDHIAIIVKNLNNALAFFQETLGLELERTALEPEQHVTVAFMPAGDSEVELVEPDETDSGLARYLEKRGEGIHHICFEVTDIDAALTHLKAAGVQLINEEPVTNSRGWRLAFVHPKAAHGVLIELYEAPA